LSLRLFLNLKKWKQRKGKKNWNDLLMILKKEKLGLYIL
jgi:hypothetical protein